MVIKNASPAAKERKESNRRCRELMRLIKSGKASEAQIKEFAALPRDIGPSRGKALEATLAGKSQTAP